MKYIHIGAINRSGGSLLTRLLDGHPDVASYPLEIAFPFDYQFYPFVDHLAGTPTSLPDYNQETGKAALDYLGVAGIKGEVVHRWGKERGDPVGVRKNYIEKEFYGKVKTDFDYLDYVDEIKLKSEQARTLQDIYDVKHRAYFNAWDKGAHAGSLNYVVTHTSDGLFLSDMDKYFSEFQGSLFVTPVRDITGYIASEKTRICRRFYGSRRFPKVKMPNFFVKTFKAYDIKALIRCWMVALTRIVVLQEKYGVDGNFLVYRYENLINRTDEVVKDICTKSGLSYTEDLLQPTLMGKPWGGNSHQGKQSGVNKDLAKYYTKVLTDEELEIIDEHCGPVLDFLNNCKDTPCDLTQIPKQFLFDYEFQKKYFDDKEKIAIYTAFAFTGMRKKLISAPDFTSVAAYLYSKMVYVVHIPRLIKLNLFPGLGKQNYT